MTDEGGHFFDRYLGQEVAFPFGHGLSYTSFDYAWAGGGAPAYDAFAEQPIQLGVRVSNTGAVAAREVVQVYLAFPAAAGEPALQLRRYMKTPLLAPGEHHDCSFVLSTRDLSVWDEGGVHRDHDLLSISASFTYDGGHFSQVQPGASWQGAWQRAAGTFEVSVGASSRDLRLNAAVHVPEV